MVVMAEMVSPATQVVQAAPVAQVVPPVLSN